MRCVYLAAIALIRIKFAFHTFEGQTIRLRVCQVQPQRWNTRKLDCHLRGPIEFMCEISHSINCVEWLRIIWRSLRHTKNTRNSLFNCDIKNRRVLSCSCTGAIRTATHTERKHTKLDYERFSNDPVSIAASVNKHLAALHIPSPFVQSKQIHKITFSLEHGVQCTRRQFDIFISILRVSNATIVLSVR